jgi:hypothetical protein
VKKSFPADVRHRNFCLSSSSSGLGNPRLLLNFHRRKNEAKTGKKTKKTNKNGTKLIERFCGAQRDTRV